MNEESEDWKPCESCGANRARVELRTTIQREWTLGFITIDGCTYDRVLDAKLLDLEESTFFCFGCYVRVYGPKHLDDFGEEIGDRKDVKMQSR